MVLPSTYIQNLIALYHIVYCNILLTNSSSYLLHCPPSTLFYKWQPSDPVASQPRSLQNLSLALRMKANSSRDWPPSPYLSDYVVYYSFLLPIHSSSHTSFLEIPGNTRHSHFLWPRVTLLPLSFLCPLVAFSLRPPLAVLFKSVHI